jgi:HAE1 family hydrophobic/amphiphilic exporter-1
LRELRQKLREELPVLAGVTFRLGNDDDGSGGAGGERFSVTLHGEDSDELARLSGEVKRRLTLLDGVEDVTTDIEKGAEEVRVHVDSQLASRYGLSARTVAEVMGITFRGVQLPRLRTDRREVDLWVVLDPEDRRDLESLQSMVLSVQDDKDITLDQVASTSMARGDDRITRRNQKTAVGVEGTYEGEDFDKALKDVREVMEAMHFPAGYGWNFGSRIQNAQENQSEMGVNALLAVACVYMIMASLFESLIHPGIVMFCMPFAILGVIWLLVLTSTPVNIMAMIGMVILIGIVVNNGIVLVDHINHHRREGATVEEAVVRGGRERFRPILMTATTTILGLVPLALGQGHLGDAQNYPMARALIGGLASSTFLTLVMLPTYYRLGERIWWLARNDRRRLLMVPVVWDAIRRRLRRKSTLDPATVGAGS